jgi:tripartite-type tricarboxylate transporter receptor subunit TctC
VRLVVSATVGSTSDLVARALASPVGALLEQPIVIEARGGAAGKVAVDLVSNAAPDGYTLLLANSGTLAIVPGGRGMLPIEPGKSLLPVTMLSLSPIVVAVNPRLPVESLAALVERARTQPGRLSYASGEVGSTSHMAAMIFARRTGVQMQQVPYPSTAAAVRDVLSGEVPVIFTQLGTIGALVQAGQLRALALAAERRVASFPELETVAEAGYPGTEISTWYGIVVPAGTTRAIVMRLHSAFVQALAAPGLRRQFATFALEPVGSTPEQFATTLDLDQRRWSELVRAHADAIAR